MLINYEEVLVMLYLSKLVYDYHENEEFDLSINETLFNYTNRLNKEFEEGIDNDVFINIKDALLYLSIYYPNSKIYNFISNEETDIQCGILLCDKNITFTFKGTDSLIDCYYDLNFIKRNIDLSKIQIHRGFFDQLMSIYDLLIYNLNNILLFNPNHTIYITGHSAGSAQGTLFAYLISKIYVNKTIKLITFGGPKIGNYEWRESFNNIKNIIHYRISNETDIITKIPNIQYYHVGNNILLTKNKIFLIDDKYCCDECCEFTQNCFCKSNNSCMLLSILYNINYLNINNHKIDNYYTNLINKKNIWFYKFNNKISDL